jgi:16S rRNA C1402 (ribose-2'-O) methylase RsmI
MDTPYRLGAVLSDVEKVFGQRKQITLACDLTQHSESILRGEISEIIKQVLKRKAEFILIIHA